MIFSQASIALVAELMKAATALSNCCLAEPVGEGVVNETSQWVSIAPLWPEPLLRA